MLTIEATGTIKRRREMKMRAENNLVLMMLDSIGRLADKFYYAESAMFVSDESIAEIGPRATVFNFGKNGTACKRHWEQFETGVKVEMTAKVEPWGNQRGGYIKRVESIRHLPGQDEAK